MSKESGLFEGTRFQIKTSSFKSLFIFNHKRVIISLHLSFIFLYNDSTVYLT